MRTRSLRPRLAYLKRMDTTDTATAQQTPKFDASVKQTSSPGSLINPSRYTGRESHPEPGLYYYRARYYHPSAGRFMSEDPTGFKGGVNFYPYAANDPTDQTDPMGFD